MKVFAGDIRCSCLEFENTNDCDTLCDEKDPSILESMEFPELLFKVGYQPKSKADKDKMGVALQKTCWRRS